MDEQSVRDAIAVAVERLFAGQPDIFRLTPESAQDRPFFCASCGS